MSDKKAYDREYYLKNRQRISDRVAAWRKANPERHQATQKTYSLRVRETINARTRRRHEERAEMIRACKSVPCTDCGKSYPHYVMDFDHVRGVKVADISQMKTMAMKKISDEIAKCDVVCANCHRERTHGG